MQICIKEKGSQCHYDASLDIIVLGENLLDEDNLNYLNWLFQHEVKHRNIHIKHGLLRGLFSHVWLDYKDRFKFMTVNSDIFKWYFKITRNSIDRGLSEVLFSCVYHLLTLPTYLFGYFCLIRAAWVKVRGVAHV